jgi:hydrogenase maturation protein HypF
MPYDRFNTSLKEFPLCEECLVEYKNPKNRRFHAESMACINCGPMLYLEDSSGIVCYENKISEISKRLIREIKNGKIIALRGLGGFQLVCDARNQETIAKLRKKKFRPNQSFALMAKDIVTIKQECLLSSDEEEILRSSASPILILELKKDTTIPMNLIAPDHYNVGVMLATTPIHHLLFGLDKISFDFLVVTSGNARGKPIAITNEEAKTSLSSIADFFILHNREIKRRADDSIATTSDEKIQYWRQGRGVTPLRFLTQKKIAHNILALGSDQKNTITLAYGNTLNSSPHMGTLENNQAISAFLEMSEKLPAFYEKKIELIAVDKHPDYFSSRYGRELALNLNIPCIEIQHHHAHAKAVMAEHNLKEAVAIIFDGTGFGDDGTIWGGELLFVKEGGYTRLGHLTPYQLPGGASAISAPWKIALTFCDSLSIIECANLFHRSEEEIEIIRKVLKQGINTPLTSSMGRLFDAASAILQISPSRITYEAEAAIRLEKWATNSTAVNNAFHYQATKLNGKILIDPQCIMNELLNADKQKVTSQDLAYRFHYTVAMMILDFALEGSHIQNNYDIVLSGGVFQNKLLLKLTTNLLRRNGLTPFIAQYFPPGDGQISIGQALIASEWLF